VILLTVEGLTIRYGNTAVVESLSFQVSEGESIGIVGESGSGKSQTALALLGLLPASAEATGKVLVGETEMLGADEVALNRVRARKIGGELETGLAAARLVRMHEDVFPCHGNPLSICLRSGNPASCPVPERKAKFATFAYLGIDDSRHRSAPSRMPGHGLHAATDTTRR